MYLVRYFRYVVSVPVFGVLWFFLWFVKRYCLFLFANAKST